MVTLDNPKDIFAVFEKVKVEFGDVIL